MLRATVLTVGEHAGVPTNKAKGEKMVLEPPMNSSQRRKLGDITNLQNQKTLMNQGAKQQQEAILVSSKENAENLHKENMRLMKVVVERDGIKSELQKLRINFQKVQQQNLLLAQANTRILAEFNLSKDQLKVLQHELGCKNGLVMARKTLLKEKPLPYTLHASEVKAPANAYGGDCKTFQPNGADHKNASESSNVNSLQINEKANNKRPGETCQMEDDTDNRELVSDGDNAADKKEFVLDAESHINDNVQSKRYCAGRQSVSSTFKQASLRRKSARFNFQELGMTENWNGLHEDQAIAANAGCSASEQSIGSKPEAVEPHETKETTGKSRVSSRRQCANVKSQRAIKESADPPLHDDIVEESCQISSSVSMELKRESKNQPRGDEAEDMRKTSVGRPLRQAARKIKSYKEDDLWERCVGEAVEPDDTKETTGKFRFCSDR